MAAPEPPRHALVAAGPGRPGAGEALALLPRGAALLLTGDGLRWLGDAAFLADSEARGLSLSICSRSGRDRKVDPARMPKSVRWSSLTTWFSQMPADATLWSLFP